MPRRSRTLLVSPFLIFITVLVCTVVMCVRAENNSARKKDIRDYSDAEIERIYDQWEDNDEDVLPDDELPVWKRKPGSQPGLDLSKLKDMQPDDIVKATKKGKTLMMFVTVENVANPSDLEEVTELWQDALRQMHITAQRFIIDSERAVFMFDDGALAWPAKDFLLGQERCKEVNLEGKAYPGTKVKVAADERVEL